MLSAALAPDECVELCEGDLLHVAHPATADGHLQVRPVWAHRPGSGRVSLPAWDSGYLYAQHWAPLAEA